MTPAEFKRKWDSYQGKESSAYQEHFSDLCRLLGQPTPAEADPTGSESFCFQKRVVKDAELLFELREELEPDEPNERGFADVWKKGCFAWEYKGKKKNLRIARFLNRIVFCFFAEDTGLLPKKLFSDLLKSGVDDLYHFAETLEKLFKVMAKGGTFGKDKIRHFNGHLFEESTVFELTEDELRDLAEAGEADWQFIQPSIMGTLFQRALDERQRAALGAQYTGESDIRDLVEPVLMAPLRRE